MQQHKEHVEETLASTKVDLLQKKKKKRKPMFLKKFQ